LRILLTEREMDVLRLIAQGKSNTEISRELVVVEKTVEKHVANILRKTGTKNRTEAAAWIVKYGQSGLPLDE
jgi:two-component system response regulator DegU